MRNETKLSKQKKIDGSIGAIINFLIVIKKKFEKRIFNKNPKKIIFLKLDAIGDAILSLPALKKLKEKTKSEIIIVCSKENMNVFEGQDFIDKIIIFKSKKINKDFFKTISKIKKEKADICIDAGQSANLSAIITYISSKYSIGFKKIKGKSRNKVYDFVVYPDQKKHMIWNYFELIKPLKVNQKEFPELIKLKYNKENLRMIEEKLKNKKNFIGIHPSNIFEYREWPRKNFAKIIEYLIKKKYNVVLVGSPQEKEKVKLLIKEINKKYRKNILNFAGKTNIKELFALMIKLKMFIANDGGPMHIAAAMGVTTIGIFGSDTPFRYAPLSKKSISLYKVKNHLKCKKKFLNEWPKCKNPEHIKSIKVEQVKKAIDSLIKNKLK